MYVPCMRWSADVKAEPNRSSVPVCTAVHDCFTRRHFVTLSSYSISTNLGMFSGEVDLCCRLIRDPV